MLYVLSIKNCWHNMWKFAYIHNILLITCALHGAVFQYALLLNAYLRLIIDATKCLNLQAQFTAFFAWESS